MLYLFDLDGTLITPYMDNADKAYDVWSVLPGRRERLAALLSAGHQVAIVTNQAGVAFGFISEADAERKIAQAIKALGLPTSTPVAVCYAHEKSRDPRYNAPDACARRKPAPGMLLELMAQSGVSADQAVMVGDLGSDEEAARAAGVRFVLADAFFKEDQ